MVANIWVAAADDELDTVKQHISLGNFSANSKDPNGYTPIHAAVSYGHKQLIKYLIEQGGNINIQDNEGDTPLHHVEDLEIAKLLVEEYKADYKVKNNDDLTPGMYIEEEDEYPDVAQYLRSLTHDGPGEDMSLPNGKDLPLGNINGHEIRYTMQDDTPEQLDPEELEARRVKLEAILNSDNPEEGLRELVEKAVHEGLKEYKQEQEQDEPSTKRSRN